jgi:TadE-like protein
VTMSIFRRPRNARRRTRGQALVEFALAAPVFFFVSFGLIELGRAVYYTQILDNAARDGTRYAVVHGFQSFCPSGPMPGGDVNPCDPNGTRVIDTVKARAIGVTNKSGALVAHVKWCDATLYQTDPPQSTCGDYDLTTHASVPCGSWSGLGDGDNNRGQIVTVCISYTYDALLAAYLPIPDFTVSGRASLVVNN